MTQTIRNDSASAQNLYLHIADGCKPKRTISHYSRASKIVCCEKFAVSTAQYPTAIATNFLEICFPKWKAKRTVIEVLWSTTTKICKARHCYQNTIFKICNLQFGFRVYRYNPDYPVFLFFTLINQGRHERVPGRYITMRVRKVPTMSQALSSIQHFLQYSTFFNTVHLRK